MVSKEDVRSALEGVEDPELPLSIVDMGLIYDIRVEEHGSGALVEVDMTFTAMGCPAMDLLHADVREAVSSLDGVEAFKLRTVWDPPWTKKRLSERARAVLEAAGVGV